VVEEISSREAAISSRNYPAIVSGFLYRAVDEWRRASPAGEADVALNRSRGPIHGVEIDSV